MSHKNLSLYINDHLAGSVGALRLLDRLRREVERPEVVRELGVVRRQVQEDQDTLHEMRRELGIGRSRWREWGAMAAQLLSNLKFRLEASKHGEVQLLHALDSLTMGIEGKKTLWHALRAAQEINPRLRLADYDRLLDRADEQLARLEELREPAAMRAFAPGED
jgi:hypothetical protein